MSAVGRARAVLYLLALGVTVAALADDGWGWLQFLAAVTDLLAMAVVAQAGEQRRTNQIAGRRRR